MLDDLCNNLPLPGSEIRKSFIVPGSKLWNCSFVHKVFFLGLIDKPHLIPGEQMLAIWFLGTSGVSGYGI